jgi:hypothetical protein
MGKRIAWGAHPYYLDQVPKSLQKFKQWVRKIWDGHYHF